jgi:hypothetical protein
VYNQPRDKDDRIVKQTFSKTFNKPMNKKAAPPDMKFVWGAVDTTDREFTEVLDTVRVAPASSAAASSPAPVVTATVQSVQPTAQVGALPAPIVTAAAQVVPPTAQAPVEACVVDYIGGMIKKTTICQAIQSNRPLYSSIVPCPVFTVYQWPRGELTTVMGLVAEELEHRQEERKLCLETVFEFIKGVVNKEKEKLLGFELFGSMRYKLSLDGADLDILCMLVPGVPVQGFLEFLITALKDHDEGILRKWYIKVDRKEKHRADTKSLRWCGMSFGVRATIETGANADKGALCSCWTDHVFDSLEKRKPGSRLTLYSWQVFARSARLAQHHWQSLSQKIKSIALMHFAAAVIHLSFADGPLDVAAALDTVIAGFIQFDFGKYMMHFYSDGCNAACLGKKSWAPCTSEKAHRDKHVVMYMEVQQLNSTARLTEESLDLARTLLATYIQLCKGTRIDEALIYAHSDNYDRYKAKIPPPQAVPFAPEVEIIEFPVDGAPEVEIIEPPVDTAAGGPHTIPCIPPAARFASRHAQMQRIRGFGLPMIFSHVDPTADHS